MAPNISLQNLILSANEKKETTVSFIILLRIFDSKNKWKLMIDNQIKAIVQNHQDQFNKKTFQKKWKQNNI